MTSRFSDSQVRPFNAIIYQDEHRQIHCCLRVCAIAWRVRHGGGARGGSRHRGAQIRQMTQRSACGRTLAGGAGGAEDSVAHSHSGYHNRRRVRAASLSWQPLHSDSWAGYRSRSARLRRLRPRLTPLSGRRRRADQSNDARSPARGGVGALKRASVIYVKLRLQG